MKPKAKKIFIGNDLVDLKTPEVKEKHLNTRFLDRVLSPNEKKLLNRSDNPSLFFWVLWSAKEAAYKGLKKQSPEINFAHRMYEVQIDCPNNFLMGSEHNAYLKHPSGVCLLKWIITNEYIHCIGVSSVESELANLAPVLNSIDKDLSLSKDVYNDEANFSQSELESIYSPESMSVRSLAKSLISFENVEIIRKKDENKFLPPEIYSNGQKIKNTDLSLSHDGRYVAAAIYNNSIH
jgi:phosphopantetheine--protein transferase-like protein